MLLLFVIVVSDIVDIGAIVDRVIIVVLAVVVVVVVDVFVAVVVVVVVFVVVVLVILLKHFFSCEVYIGKAQFNTSYSKNQKTVE